MEDLTGRHFGPYHIVAPLGEGGMAAVFKAYQPSMERHVAIKVLPKRLVGGAQFAGRFKQEALVLARLQHPHILPVFDYGEADGYTYLVMPLIESGTLKDLLRGQPLPLEQIRDCISQVGDALDYAHAQNLVHRDVKPGNVLLDGRGNCLLTDFGIAKMVEGSSQFTATGGVVGTPDYMSPEQGRGDPVDARTDIYTLGVLLYEMATGRVPFTAETPVAVIFKHIQDPLPAPRELNPRLPATVEAVIVKALAKEPQDRYATAGELVQALQAAIPADATPAEELAKTVPEGDSTSGAGVLSRQSPVAASVGRGDRAIKRAALGLWILLAISVLALGSVLALTLAYASKYGFLRVPFASVFVFGLCGLILVLDGAAFIFWRRSRELGQELVELTRQPLEDDIPTIYGHKHVDQAEFLTIVQILFRHSFDARYVQVRPLPGGYGGSSTVLTRLQRQQGAPALPRSFVVKLGRQSEMADEYGKFRTYVSADLTCAARFFRYAVWEESAGIAYEFVGLDPEHEIQSFYQFYQGYATVEVVELIGKIYQRLDRAWYHNRRQERVDLYQEYRLLGQKREYTIGHMAEIVEPSDHYRANFTAIEKRLQPNLKPDFCPDLDIPWHDPVAFLRAWPRQNLELDVYRSVVHGDLHARNVLVEIEKSGHKRVWFIDFSHTGNGLSGERTRQTLREGIPVTPDRGHVLRDFCRLEADVKFILTRLRDEDDLELAVAFEKALSDCGLELYDLSSTPPIEALQKEYFRKAWQVIGEIRRQAAAHLVHPDDARAYYLSLLHATLPMVYYHPDQFENEACERQQKRYALLSAGMLCAQL